MNLGFGPLSSSPLDSSDQAGYFSRLGFWYPWGVGGYTAASGTIKQYIVYSQAVNRAAFY